jgi:Zn-dependent protease with chaperone function
MRLTYLIRCVNAWFVRAVYQRDGLDESLASWCTDTGRFAPIFWLGAIGVAITRGILWLFMHLGLAISAFLERQMEFDADRYGVRLVGSRVMEETARRTLVLSVVANDAYSYLGESLSEGKLVHDLAALIVAGADQTPAALRRKLERAMRKAKTGFFDTHPSYQARVTQIRALKAPGVFSFDLPASVLFSNYEKLTNRVTQDFYRENLAELGKLL